MVIGVLIPGTQPKKVATRSGQDEFTGILIQCPQDVDVDPRDIEILLGYNGVHHYVPCCKCCILQPHFLM